MTNLEQLQFIANVQIGSKIQGYANSVMIVTGTYKSGFKGYSEYAFKKFGKKTDTRLAFSTISNPHYNKGLSIIN